MEELITLHIRAEDYDVPQSWRLATWCREHGADEWTLSTIAGAGAASALTQRFDAVTAPFRLPTAKRRRLTAYVSDAGLVESFIKPTELWRLNSVSLAVLQESLPDGLFTYGSSEDEWFEDPVLYRGGEFMLGVVSHESEGIVRVTQKERQSLEAEGFIFRPFGAYVGY